MEYQEYQWENPPAEKPRFQNNTAELADILLRIGEFADRIECGSFGKIFRNAREILNGRKAIPDGHDSGMPVLLPRIPEAEKRLFFAASMEDVFGAWVPGMTIRLAALYEVNES